MNVGFKGKVDVKGEKTYEKIENTARVTLIHHKPFIECKVPSTAKFVFNVSLKNFDRRKNVLMLKEEENHENYRVAIKMISRASTNDVILDGEQFNKTDQLIHSCIIQSAKLQKFRVLHTHFTRTVNVTMNAGFPI